MSHSSARSKPPPIAGPFTAAIVGFGKLQTARWYAVELWRIAARQLELPELAEVEARRECRSGAGQDDHPHPRVVTPGRERVHQLGAQLDRERVALVGARQGDHGDPVVVHLCANLLVVGHRYLRSLICGCGSSQRERGGRSRPSRRTRPAVGSSRRGACSASCVLCLLCLLPCASCASCGGCRRGRGRRRCGGRRRRGDRRCHRGGRHCGPSHRTARRAARSGSRSRRTCCRRPARPRRCRGRCRAPG